MSCVNLFALVQVAVVMNFGLVFIGTDNFYNLIKKEFKLYINSITTNTIKFAEQQLRRVPRYPRDITVRLNKAGTEDALHKLKGIVNLDDVKSYYLACWGVFAGVYCIAFLFTMAFEKTGVENALKDAFFSLMIVILFFGVLSYEILRNDRMSEAMARSHIIHILRRFALFSVVGTVLAYIFFDHPYFEHLDVMIPISVVIAYLPSIWVVIRLFWQLRKIRICQKNCWDSAVLLKNSLNG